MSTVQVTCHHCGIDFEKSLREFNRSEKLNRNHFCCLGHAAAYRNKVVPKSPLQKTIAKQRCKEMREKIRDKYTEFRYLLKRIKTNSKGKFSISLSLGDIRQQWEKQKGICPYTGVKLKLPVSTIGFKDKKDKLHNASIDRIDSSKGYEPQNIQFVSQMANFAKNSLTHENMVEFCQAISEHWGQN